MQIIKVEYRCDVCGVDSVDPFETPKTEISIDGKSRHVDLCKSCVDPIQRLWSEGQEIPNRPQPKVRHVTNKGRTYEGYPKKCEFEDCDYVGATPPALGAHKWHRHGVTSKK